MKNSKVGGGKDETLTNPCQSRPELPEVIISDILSRLPVKTICRFRCICKSWHKLLLDPYFAQLHIPRSPTTLIARHPTNRELYMVELHESIDLLTTLGPLKISPKFCQLAFKMKPIASCNGLVLLTEYSFIEKFWYKNYRVCNPIMGQYMNIPNPTNRRDAYYGEFVGFGFSPSTKQYKIMQFWRVHTHYEVEIHTLGTNMWRSIGGFVPKELVHYSAVAYLNGAFHWIDYTHDVVCINRFDLGNERFEQRIPGPPLLVKKACNLNLCFGVSGEHLYIIDSFGSANVDVWIMKDYGMGESWTKESIISPISVNCEFHIEEPVKILHYGTSSVLIMRCGSKYNDTHFVAFNLESKSMRGVHVSWLSCQSLHDQIPHVPSFISLKDAVVDGENFRIDEFGCVSKQDLYSVQSKKATPYLDALLSNIVPPQKVRRS